ncbi:Imm8 family immunity protein [Actinobacillus genomosp. 1]|uniref:Imm8 family immunity protein n=1 Tax=Actinobacillus genomosp. 1 TaxID=254839 RepID=UPI00244242F1|nr:Imm8 family immunity protein [Actinobacillus genomosp. 1]WGE92206.1 immunity 8 family protein [Actinobacillus genomosp. 1]
MVIADLKSINYCGVSSKNEAQELMLDPTGYNLKISLTIGEKGKEGGDYFAVEVFNTQLVKSAQIVLASKSFIVCDDIDDIDDIEREIKYKVNSISGEDWEEVLNKLRYYFDWEYENLKFVS